MHLQEIASPVACVRLICSLLTLLAPSAAMAATIPSSWENTTGSGNWSDPANWNPDNSVPNNNGDTYAVTVRSAAGDLTQDIVAGVTIESLDLAGGTIVNPNNLWVVGNGFGGSPSVWGDRGKLTGGGTTTFSGKLTATGNNLFDLEDQTVVISSSGVLTFGDGRFRIYGDSVIENQGVFEIVSDGDLKNFGGENTSVNNSGVFKYIGGTFGTSIGPKFNNSGILEFQIDARFAFGGGFEQTSGRTTVAAGGLEGSSGFTILGGLVEGNGEIKRNTVHPALEVKGTGVLGPGVSNGDMTGKLTIADGGLRLSEDAVLQIDIDGRERGESYDFVHVTKTRVTLGGTLELIFLPSLGELTRADTFTVLAETAAGAGDVIGEFTNASPGHFVSLGGESFGISYGSGSPFDVGDIGHVILSDFVFQTFSITSQGPSVGALDIQSSVSITEGDIIAKRPGPLFEHLPPSAVSVMVGATPSGIGVVPGGLGINPTLDGDLELDALSYGRDDGLVLHFSVDELATGTERPPPRPRDLFEEGASGVQEAAADVFMLLADAVQTSPPWTNHGNYGNSDGDGVSTPYYAYGLGLIEPNDPATPGDGDDLDALDTDSRLTDLNGPIFFSLDAATAAAQAGGFSGSDVLVASEPGVGPTIAITAEELGLDPVGDDLDALAFNDADGSQSLTAGDAVFFSVRTGSATIGTLDSDFGVAISAGDILTAPLTLGQAPAIFISHVTLGLADDDEVDAIDISVPEPGLVASLAYGAAMLALLRRRRIRR